MIERINNFLSKPIPAFFAAILFAFIILFAGWLKDQHINTPETIIAPTYATIWYLGVLLRYWRSTHKH